MLDASTLHKRLGTPGEKFDPRDPVQLERFRKVREEVGNRRMVIRTRGKRTEA